MAFTSGWDPSSGVLSAQIQGDALSGLQGGTGIFGAGAGDLGSLVTGIMRYKDQRARQQQAAQWAREDALRKEQEQRQFQAQQAAKQQAESQAYQNDMKERGDKMEFIRSRMQMAQRYGGNPDDAATSASSDFNKMKLGVPGNYGV